MRSILPAGPDNATTPYTPPATCPLPYLRRLTAIGAAAHRASEHDDPAAPALRLALVIAELHTAGRRCGACADHTADDRLDDCPAWHDAEGLTLDWLAGSPR